MPKILEFLKVVVASIGGGFSASRAAIISLFKKEAVKFALAKLAKGILKGSFGNWIITFAVEYLFEELVQPLMKLAFNYMGYQYDRIDGKVKVMKLDKAKRDGDGKAYDIIVDDIIG